ncbi:DUF2726 domain-containing protein [Herbaspirillum sp. RV1423]|uniref:DUF2726 domain-containing protein n=1 Tax=Herbaspirillum sp. RV1423 TaxID=1443993 RepID=UPI0004B86789|nr:DUF2726 domain-containing protein [Herbaspirillum sp. RV1423]
MVFRPDIVGQNESFQDYLDRAEQSWSADFELTEIERLLQMLSPKKLFPREAMLLKLLQQWRPSELIWCQVHLLQLFQIDQKAMNSFNQWWAHLAPQGGFSLTNATRWKILNPVTKLSLDFVIADTSGNILFAIELDGRSHTTNDRQIENDEVKTFLLRHLGISLLRIDNAEIDDSTLHAALQRKIQNAP